MIKRQKYLDLIQKELEQKDTILFLIGARQVGKTTLLRSLEEFGYISPEATVFVDGDKVSANGWTNGDDFLVYIKTYASLQGILFIIIDEAQYIRNIWIILKNLIDDVRVKKYAFKIIVSGSGSMNVFTWITDTLTGRKKVIQVRPFDFGEFCQAKGTKEMHITKANLSIFQQLFAEYARYGWYPKVILTDDPAAKQELFVQLLNDYLFKDIALLLAEKDIINLKKYLKILATFTCSLVKISTIAESIGISRYTLEKYFFVLENTFLFDIVPWFTGWNAAGETRKMTKFYLQDLGFLRFLLGIDNRLGTNKGKMVETFICNQMYANKTPLHNVHFRHTRSGAEVDFIVHNQFNGKILPIEVKAFDHVKISRSLDLFCSYYTDKIDTCIITTETERTEKKTSNGKKIIFSPYIAIDSTIYNSLFTL